MGCTSSRSEITTPIQSPTGLSQAEGQDKAFTTVDRRPSQSKSKTSPAVAPAPETKSANQQAKYIAIFDAKPEFTKAVIMEHFMPYEFPICPVITSESQRLVVDSWKNIVGSEYESEDVASGKVSGATYFYNQFFDQLFARLRDFERIFPNIKARADIISHVMAMITSVRAENLDFMKLRLKALGKFTSFSFFVCVSVNLRFFLSDFLSLNFRSQAHSGSDGSLAVWNIRDQYSFHCSPLP